MRFVLDTNVIVSALLTPHSTPRQAFDKALHRDPKDNKFLELAVDGKASCLIAGDADLLVLNPFCGIPVLTPTEFLSQEFPESARQT